MKNIFLTFFILTLSLNAFADKTEIIRTLSCKSVVKGSDKSKKVLTMTIQDLKNTFKEGKTTFVDYWSTLTFNDLRKNNGEKLFGNVTSVESYQDVQKHRDAPRDGSWGGLTFYEIFKVGKDSSVIGTPPKMSRLGLITISSLCTTEENPKAKKCANPRGKRNYEVLVQFGERDDKNVIAYAGKLECALNSKAIAE